jgi:hypothetical protein
MNISLAQMDIKVYSDGNEWVRESFLPSHRKDL